MLICPNCASDTFTANTEGCDACGWRRFEEEGIQNFLTGEERASELANRYASNYESLAVKNLDTSNIDRRFLRNQAKNLTKYVGLHLEGRLVCDVGIGQGFLCDEMLQLGAKHVSAVDISRSYLKRFAGSSQVTPYLANAENLPFKEHFDVLVSTDVMEHVLNVGSFLYSINRALKLDGIAAIRVPYREPLLHYSPHAGYSHAFGHLRSFNKDILRLYMEQAGFSVESFHLDGFSPGTPQPYLYSTTRRKVFYHKLLRIMNRFLKNSSDATLWNEHFACLVMRPVELVVIARKTGTI